MICLVVTHQVHGEFFLKVPTKVPSGYFLNEPPRYFLKEPIKLPSRYFLNEPPEFFHNFAFNVPTMNLSHSLRVLSKSTHQFDHNVPSHILNGFFESLWENSTKLRVYFWDIKKNPCG